MTGRAIAVGAAAVAAVALGAWWLSSRRPPYERGPGCTFLVHDLAASVQLARRLGAESTDADLFAGMRRDLAAGCELDLWGEDGRPDDLRFRFALVQGYVGGAVGAQRLTLDDALNYLATARGDAMDAHGIALPEGL